MPGPGGQHPQVDFNPGRPKHTADDARCGGTCLLTEFDITQAFRPTNHDDGEEGYQVSRSHANAAKYSCDGMHHLAAFAPIVAAVAGATIVRISSTTMGRWSRPELP